MPINCVGIDAVEIKRFLRVNSSVKRFSQKIFTQNEIGVIGRSQAGNFAAKEAIRKAFWEYIRLDFLDFEVLRAFSGRPIFILVTPTLISESRIEIQSVDLSITYSSELAIACAQVVFDFNETQIQ